MCKRYQVVKGSENARCFKAAVIDTKSGAHARATWVCECFDLVQAHAIADAMNMADEAPLDEKTPEPVYQDRCGKEFSVHSALLYFPGGKGEPRVVLPCQSESDFNTNRWEMYVDTLVGGHQYVVRGDMFKKHPWLLKLEASFEDIQAAF